MEKRYYVPWQKGVLAARVINDAQVQPFRRQTVMAMIDTSQANGWRCSTLEHMEAAISIIDDAIDHMMGVTR